MNSFIYQPQPVRIIFGYRLPEALERELPKRGVTNIWIIASQRFEALVQDVDALPGVNVTEHFSRILQHVPVDQVQKARHAVAKSRPDILMPIGGGSAIGLAKAVALRHPLPIWAVPTTYSGSEMTNIYGISTGDTKDVGRHADALPKMAFYDPELSLSLPPFVAAKSAMNALSHLVETLYSPKNNPFTYQYALVGIRTIVDGLTDLAAQESMTRDINETLLLGASMGGKLLSETEMGLHHKSANVLGGSYGLDHAGTHTVLLPYVLKYQWESLNADIKENFRDLFSSDDPPKALLKLITILNLPTSLKEIGCTKEQSKSAAEQIVNLDFRNPAPVTEQSVQLLLENAWHGHLRD